MGSVQGGCLYPQRGADDYQGGAKGGILSPKGNTEGQGRFGKGADDLREQTEEAKADTVVEFKVSQSFINAFAFYYSDGFDDCLKQVGSIYPDLDLSKISMDDPVLPTPGGGDTIDEESDDSTHAEEQVHKDEGVVIA